MINKEQLLDSLQKIDISLEEGKTYLIIFKKDEWNYADMSIIASHLNSKKPESSQVITSATENGTLLVEELSREEKKQLIKILTDSL